MIFPRRHDALFFPSYLPRSIHKQRCSIRSPIGAGGKVVAYVARAVAFALLLGTSLLLLATKAQAANLLFSSGFEGTTALNPPYGCWGTGCWQDIVGTDSSTGFTWPPNIWGGGSNFFLLADAPVDAASIRDYMFNQILTVTGHKGTQTRTLYSQMTQSGCCGGDATQGQGATSNDLLLQPANEAGDLYISYWFKFQPDLLQQLTPQNWRFLSSFKSAGDFRAAIDVVTWGNVAPYWLILGDNAAGALPYQEFWRVENRSIEVPIGRWFKLEVFWHRSGNFTNNGGRYWVAVDGQPIADVSSGNLSNVICAPPCNTSMMGVSNAPIDRIFVSGNYGGGPYPMYYWLDDLQIWDGFPPANGNDPPYAPHQP